MKTRNFILIPDDTVISDEEMKNARVDRRNNILCLEPTFDWDCWINYINLLNSVRDKWVNTSYIDMGMVPLLMAPTFMNESMVKPVYNIVNQCGIRVYPTNPIPLMVEKTRSQTKDLWAFKSDVARVIGIPENKLSVIDFIRWCKNNEPTR